MPQITAVHLAAIFLLTSLTSQAVSQTTLSANSTVSPMSNQTVSTNINGTMATSTFNGPMNTTTSPAGAAYQLQSSVFFVVILGAMATMLLYY